MYIRANKRGNRTYYYIVESIREGNKIKQNAADVMSKLDIKPFSIGFIPLCAFDTHDKKLYLEINIDREGTLKDLKYRSEAIFARRRNQ